VTYFWEHLLQREGQQPVVFVHFLNKGMRFQDDHVLPRPFAARPITGLREVNAGPVRRRVRLPPDFPPGMCRVQIGLCDPVTRARYRPHTDATVDRRAIVLNNVLEVRTPEESGDGD
jgi:hypothetical protein